MLVGMIERSLKRPKRRTPFEPISGIPANTGPGQGEVVFLVAQPCVPSSDPDNDGDVDLRDYAFLMNCFPTDSIGTPECRCGDSDIGAFVSNLTGPLP